MPLVLQVAQWLPIFSNTLYLKTIPDVLAVARPILIFFGGNIT